MSHSAATAMITTRAQLRDLIGRLRALGRFAFDTEFVSEETFEPVLCLIQVAAADVLAAIDPEAVGDVSPFWELVLDPSIQVVMHAAGEDLRICHLRTGKLPERVFDVQIAAGLAGFSYPLSLVNLAGQVLGVTLAGSETRTDWRKRPLSPAQLEYALDDVRHLFDLADRLTERLEALGRLAWAEAEFRDQVREIARRSDVDRWRRLPGLHQLGRRGLEAARRLSEWREDVARRRNRPMRQIMRDDLLTAIAKRMPRSKRDLEALRDFNRPGLLSHGQEILEVLEAARGVADDALPELPDRHEEPPGVATITNLLSAALAQCCAHNGIAGSLVGSVGDLKHLVRWRLEEDRDPARPPALLDGWRRELCGQVLLDVLEGKVALRVVDPASEYPVALENKPNPTAGSS